MKLNLVKPKLTLTKNKLNLAKSGINLVKPEDESKSIQLNKKFIPFKVTK